MLEVLSLQQAQEERFLLKQEQLKLRQTELEVLLLQTTEVFSQERVLAVRQTERCDLQLLLERRVRSLVRLDQQLGRVHHLEARHVLHKVEVVLLQEHRVQVEQLLSLEQVVLLRGLQVHLEVQTLKKRQAEAVLQAKALARLILQEALLKKADNTSPA